MKMNNAKTKKIVFTAGWIQALLPPCQDIERVSSLRVLGVIINDKLTAADHVTTLLTSCSSLFYTPFEFSGLTAYQPSHYTM